MLAQSRLKLFKFCRRARLCCAVSVFQSQSGSRAGTVGAAFNFGKFKFLFLSVTLWHYPYSSTETQCSTLRLKLRLACSHGHGAAPAPGAGRRRLFVPPAGPALPGQPEVARLSSAQVVRQASRIMVQQ